MSRQNSLHNRPKGGGNVLNTRQQRLSAEEAELFLKRIYSLKKGKEISTRENDNELLRLLEETSVAFWETDGKLVRSNLFFTLEKYQEIEQKIQAMIIKTRNAFHRVTDGSKSQRGIEPLTYKLGDILGPFLSRFPLEITDNKF